MDDLYEIAYLSEARRAMSTMELSLLLRSCRERNQANGVTGMLLYADRSFLQIIEGPKATVEQTFQRISLDDRHGRLLQLIGSAQTKRTFAGWLMGFVDGRATSTRLAGLTNYLQGGWTSHPPSDVRSRSLLLLEQFRAGRLRGAVEATPRQSQLAMAAVRLTDKN